MNLNAVGPSTDSQRVLKGKELMKVLYERLPIANQSEMQIK